MLQKIISFSVKNKWIVTLGVIALVIGGIWQMTRLPIDAVPDITDNQVQVISVVPSLGAPDVERLITVPVEQGTRNISGIKNIRSFSRFGLSIVTIVFEEDIDVYWARQQVSERLITIQQQLPAGLTIPTMAPITTGLGEIYQYVLRPAPGYEAKYSPTELRTLQDFIVRKQLRGVAGVADVSSYGGFQKQYEVSLDPAKMQQLHIGVNEVFEALQKENNNAGGTYIEKGMQALFIRTEGLLKTIPEIENIVVKRFSVSEHIAVKDIAAVKEGKATRYGAMCYNNQGEVAGAVVMMLKGGNSNEVIKNVKVKVEEVRKMLPKGVMLEPFLDRTKMVNNAIGTVEKNLAEGALIVIFVLVLVLGNFRAGLIVASVIPLAMLFAIILMNFFGVSGNLMSLGALDFGLIVDGAVIIVESILHQLWKRELLGTFTKEHREHLVVDNAGKMMNSAVFGQLIILVVYLPIFSLQGIEGKMFIPMAQTVAFALIGAFLLSLTYVPMMCSRFLPLQPGRFQQKSELAILALEKWFVPKLRWAIHHFKPMILGALILFVFALYGLLQLGGEFIPELEEGDFAADTRILTGSSVNATIEATQKASDLLLKTYPEIDKIVTKVGNGEIPTDPMPMEASDLMIILKDKKDWKSAESYDELAEKMSNTVSVIPGLSVGFQYPVQMRFNELMTGAKQDVVCKIYGEDMDTLANMAKKVGAIANRIKGAKDVYVEQVVGQPQVVIQLNREKMKRYGLRTEELNQLVETSFSGAVAGKIYEGERPFDLVIRMNDNVRNSIEDIKETPIAMPGGDIIPLSAVADIALVNGPNQIQRENAQRRILVGFNVRGRDVESVVNDLQTEVKNIQLPAGSWIDYGGSFENLQRARSRLLLAIPIALFLIGLLLYFAFSSITLAVLVFSAIPLSLIGGIVGLILRDMPFSISAGIGMIALFGVAVLNGIVLVAEFKRQELANPMMDRELLVIQSTAKRLRPVLMTALVAALGFLPMALSTGAGAEVQKPLATVVIGGLVTATLLTLLMLPAMYLRLGKSKQKSHLDAGLAVWAILFCTIPLSADGASIRGADGMVLSSDTAIRGNRNFNCIRKMGIEAAISEGKMKNKGLQADALVTKAGQFQSNYRLSAPAAGISADFGQVNSWYSDQKFGASQTLYLPSWYRSDFQRRKSSYQEVLMEKQLLELKWEVEVRTRYQKLELAYWQKMVLAAMTKLGEETLDKMEIRLAAGDVSKLDFNQLKNVYEQLLVQQADFENMVSDFSLELGWLIGDSCGIEPAVTEETGVVTVNQIKTIIENQPWIGSLNKAAVNPGASHVAEGGHHFSVELERSRAEKLNWEYQQAKAESLPRVQLGYIKQSFQGYIQLPQGDVFYDKKPQFTQWQVGLELPLFTTSIKREASAKSELWKAQLLRSDYLELEIQMEAEKLTQQLELLNNRMLRYQSVILPNAHQTLELANLQLSSGSISVIQWELFVKSVSQTYLDYFKTLQDIGITKIMLSYYQIN